MAKKLNLKMQTNTTAFASGGIKLSKSILIDKVEEHERFKNLYSINSDLLERIANSIKDNGFDNSQPIHIWVQEDHYYLIDGYTRVAAAKQANIKMIPCYEHNFADFEEAYRYALSLQVNRRNLDSAELFKNVCELMGSNYIKETPGRERELIAESLGIGSRTAAKAISIEKNASDELKEKLKSGEISLSQAYNDLKKSKKKTETEDNNSVSSYVPSDESLDSSEGTPSPIIISHSDGVERPHRNPWETDEYDERLKTRYMEGYSDAAQKIFYYVLGEFIKGKSPKEIYNDELLSDFSPTVIVKINFPEENEDLVLRELK